LRLFIHKLTILNISGIPWTGGFSMMRQEPQSIWNIFVRKMAIPLTASILTLTAQVQILAQVRRKTLSGDRIENAISGFYPAG